MVSGKKHSMKHALTDVVNQIQCNFKKVMFTCGVFIDLEKAFDTVDHNTLLEELCHYGISGIVSDWFHSYLTDCAQSTLIGSLLSSKISISCGVPYSFMLGSLLFLLYINDIYRSSKKLKCYLFT